MPNRVIESMTNLSIYSNVFGLCKIRVWRQETEIRDNYDNSDIIQLINKPWGSRRELIEAIEKVDRVNAVEVLDRNDNGTILYPDWK